MKQGRSRRFFCISLLAGIAVSLSVIVSCSPNNISRRFSDTLVRIDGYIASGDSGKALKNLKTLSKTAQSSTQWLSIVKRERSLRADSVAVSTLKRALKKMPANPELTAVLADTLIGMKSYQEACAYSTILEDSPYAAVSAFAEIERKRNAGPFSIDPRFWLAAASATGLPVFSRNAAVNYAMSGNFAAACDAAGGRAQQISARQFPRASIDPEEALFRATLWYDAGFPGQTLKILAPDDTTIVGLEELSLMADSAWRLKNKEESIILWERETVLHPAATPLPYYNLAVVEQNRISEKRRLESMLAMFPRYYPAVVRYVRSVPENRETMLFDPLEEQLEKAGFRSLDMERKIGERPVTRAEARRALRTALEKSGAAPDIRFVIENLRMDWFETSDAVKASSSTWQLLEKHPDDPVLRAWARWFFLFIGDAPTAIALNKDSRDGADSFYSALDRAFSGDLDKAEELFAAVAGDDLNAWCALADIAFIRERKKDFEGAVEKFSLAAGMAPNAWLASRLQYEAARVLSAQNAPKRARTLLGYALELDSSNYRADALLHKLEAEK